MKILVVSLALLAAGSLRGQSPAAPEPAAAPAAVSANSALVDDITRLWKASLSEEFINKYFAHSDLARDLTADDVVRLRSAGVPETLIASITLQRTAAGAAPAGATAAVQAARGTRHWDGLVRRNSGVVLLKSRWDSGVFEFKDASLRWVDSKDAGKNVLLSAGQVTEQELTCLKKAGGNECFEWVVKTRGEEYRFRDVAWRQGENAKVAELFEFFSGAYPSLISSRRAVDEK
jgi:hypothetical protein